MSQLRSCNQVNLAELAMKHQMKKWIQPSVPSFALIKMNKLQPFRRNSPSQQSPSLHLFKPS